MSAAPPRAAMRAPRRAATASAGAVHLDDAAVGQQREAGVEVRVPRGTRPSGRRACRRRGPPVARARARRRAGTGGSAGRRRTRWPGRSAVRRGVRRRLAAQRGVAAASVSAWSRRSAGLVSTSQTRAASRKPGIAAAARSASRISVPRPGPSSASTKRSGRALVGPDLRHPGADELAEHLADLGGGHEVAGSAEGIARGVVAVLGVAERQRHVGFERERSLRRDALPYQRLEGGRRAASVGAARGPAAPKAPAG